jgi:hypothetical protein
MEVVDITVHTHTHIQSDEHSCVSQRYLQRVPYQHHLKYGNSVDASLLIISSLQEQFFKMQHSFDLVKVKNQLDAIKYAVSLPQHVLGTNVPIIRNTINNLLPFLGGHAWKATWVV